MNAKHTTNINVIDYPTVLAKEQINIVQAFATNKKKYFKVFHLKILFSKQKKSTLIYHLPV